MPTRERLKFTAPSIANEVLEERLDNLKENFDKMDEKLNRIESKVQNLEIKVAVWATGISLAAKYLPEIVGVAKAMFQ